MLAWRLRPGKRIRPENGTSNKKFKGLGLRTLRYDPTGRVQGFKTHGIRPPDYRLKKTMQ
jgi:hypothetical protein